MVISHSFEKSRSLHLPAHAPAVRNGQDSVHFSCHATPGHRTAVVRRKESYGSSGALWVPSGRVARCLTFVIVLSLIFPTVSGGFVRKPVKPHGSPISDGLGFGLRDNPLFEDIHPLDASAWSSYSRKLPSTDSGECIPGLQFPPPDDGSAFAFGIPGTTFDAYDGGFSSDGGLFVIGQQSSTLTGASTYVIVLYFDSAFNLVWGKKILAGGSVAANINQPTFATVSGNTVTVTGFTNYNTEAGGDVLVAQFDVDGNVLWSTVFGTTGDCYGYAVERTVDGGYAVVGGAALFSAGSIGGFVAILDASGGLQWVTSLWGPIQSFAQLPDGSLFIVGKESPAISTPYLGRVDITTGSLLWASTVQIPTAGVIASTSSSTLTLTLGPHSEPLVAVSYLNTNPNFIPVSVGISVVDATSGNQTWTLTLPSTSQDFLRGMVWAPDGSLLVVGSTTSFGLGSSQDVVLMRLTPDGLITYVVALGGPLDDSGYSLRLAPEAQGGLYVIGHTSSFGAGEANPLIVYLNNYTIAPRAVGLFTVTDLTPVWLPSPVSMIQTALNATAVSRSENPAGPILSIQSAGIGTPEQLSGYATTWLTLPLLSQSLPLPTAALVEFPWSYTLPSNVYQHLGNTPLSLTLSTDAQFISVVPNTLSIVGTPILANVGTYTVNITAAATIQYIGLTVFPTISLTLCVDGTSPFSFALVTTNRVFPDTSLFGSAFIVGSNGQLVCVGAVINYLTGLSSALVGAFSDTELTEFLWATAVISPFTNSDTLSLFSAVVEVPNGNKVAAGYSTLNSGGGSVDILVGQVDLGGRLLWSFTLGGPGKDDATGVVYTPDGYTIVAGYTNSFGAGGYDALVFAIDVDIGAPIWNFTYGFTGDEQLLSLVVLPSGSLLGAGYSTDPLGAGGEDCFLLEFTSTGSVTSARLFGSTGDDVINAVAVTGSGGVMFTGSSSSGSAGGLDVLVGSLSGAGSVNYASTYGGSGADVGSGICLDVNGGVAVTGYTSSVGAGGKDILMSAYDSSGSVAWSTATGGSADDIGTQIIQSDSTLYFKVLGPAYSFEIGASPAGWLTTSPTGDLSPNFAGETVPSGLTYTAWGDTPVANATHMTASVMSGVAPFSLHLPFSVAGIGPLTSKFVSSLQYFIISELPPTVTQVPFATPFNMSLYPCIAPGIAFQKVSLVGSDALPAWLTFISSTGELSGTPSGTVRGLYYLKLTVVLLSEQSISFALNVTNTAPFYDGPTVLSTGLGNFAFSLRDYVFDAEGDSVSNYQLAPYFPPGSSVSIEPNPIATANAFTGQLEGAALSGSGGSYTYNLTMSDSFGALGWKILTLEIHQPSEIAALIEKLLPELSAAAILLAVLFALWRRDQMVNNTAHWLQQLALLYCQPHHERVGPKFLRDLGLARVDIVDTLTLTLDLDEFDPIATRATVEQYCDHLIMLAVRDQTSFLSAEVTRTVGVYTLVFELAKLVNHRLEMGPPKEFINERPSEAKTAFHMKTLFLLHCMNHVLEAMLLSFGSQLTTVTLKTRVTFVGSLVNFAILPFRFCFSGCCRQASSSGDAKFAVPHSTRQLMVNDAAAIKAWTSGSRLDDLGALCGSRKTTLLELQLRHAASRLHQSILYLPDSASGLDLLLDSLTHVLDPGSLLKDLTALIQMPSEWYTLYMSTRLSLQALLDSNNRTSRLASVQRALYSRCFQPRTCGRGLSVKVSWKLLFGCVNLFTEVLIAEPSPMSQEDRMQLRGDPGVTVTAGGPPLLTLRLLAELPQNSGVPNNEATLIRQAAIDALDLTGPVEVMNPANAALCLWTLRPSSHVRIKHDAYVSGSTLLPALKKIRFGPLAVVHPHRSPHAGLPAPETSVHARTRRIAEEVYTMSDMDTVALNERVVPFSDSPAHAGAIV